MAYDASLDATLFTAPKSQDGLIIEVKSYNNGEPKISFSRESEYRGEIQTKPAYRLTMNDMVYIGQYWQQISQVIMSQGQ